MNTFEKAVKQVERKIPHFQFILELDIKNEVLNQDYGVFNPFTEATAYYKGETITIDGKKNDG